MAKRKTSTATRRHRLRNGARTPDQEYARDVEMRLVVKAAEQVRETLGSRRPVEPETVCAASSPTKR